MTNVEMDVKGVSCAIIVGRYSYCIVACICVDVLLTLLTVFWPFDLHDNEKLLSKVE